MYIDKIASLSALKDLGIIIVATPLNKRVILFTSTPLTSKTILLSNSSSSGANKVNEPPGRTIDWRVVAGFVILRIQLLKEYLNLDDLNLQRN